MIALDESLAVLRRSFDVPAGALDRSESILELQHASLGAAPPARSIPEQAAIATIARLRSNEPVIPRDRWPIEAHRVVRLLRALGGLLPDSGIEPAAEELFAQALPPAQAGDSAGVLRAAERLGLPPDASAALLREALKPEMLRTSLPFAALVGETPRGGRCPLCRELPCAATRALDACCSWCGTIWRWAGGACPSCSKASLATREITRIVKGAALISCTLCGDALLLFDAPPDPLLLSMLAVLASPFDLAMRVQAEAYPMTRYRVF